MNYNLL